MPRALSVLLAALMIIGVACAAPAPAPKVFAPVVKLPLSDSGLRFAVLGDTGTGDNEQLEIGRLLYEYHKVFPIKLVVLLGDNLYGGEAPRDYERKFEQPYKPLLEAGVKFYASLGNHDEPAQRLYKLFNMDGKRYYSFQPKDGIRFFALDSNYMSPEQLEWLEDELRGSGSGWKIAFFHHPLYSSGKRHGSSVKLREVLEPLFLKYGVDVVLSGHEHFYERLKPQKGIYYFIAGASAKLRKGNIEKSDITAKGFDTDQSFMLVEIVKNNMYFQTISRTNETVDYGTIARRESSTHLGVTE
jgi:3',5'-cyclic AMP phosphodiesterase CpdA